MPLPAVSRKVDCLCVCLYVLGSVRVEMFAAVFAEGRALIGFLPSSVLLLKEKEEFEEKGEGFFGV